MQNLSPLTFKNFAYKQSISGPGILSLFIERLHFILSAAASIIFKGQRPK